MAKLDESQGTKIPSDDIIEKYEMFSRRRIFSLNLISIK